MLSTHRRGVCSEAHRRLARLGLGRSFGCVSANLMKVGAPILSLSARPELGGIDVRTCNSFKRTRCIRSASFGSAACIPACAKRRRRLTFSTSRRRSSSEAMLLASDWMPIGPQPSRFHPESRLIRFLRQNLRSTVFATCPRRSFCPFDADIDRRTF